MKTLTTALGFEYDIEVLSVSRDSIDYVITCEGGEMKFINEDYDMHYADVEDIEMYNEALLDRDELIENIEQLDLIEKIVDQMVKGVRN